MPAITSDYVAAQNGTGGGGIGIGNNYAADATRHHLLRLPTDKPASLPTAANTIASIIVSHFLPAAQPPSSENLVVANSGEDLTNFHDATLDFFDEDDDLFGSPLAFDASNEGLWNGLFVPPPPRPPFFEDEAVLSDGLTTCDLCSWAMPTKSTFILEGTIEKASELGWPLTLIIVSILSALLGAIIMITVVRCRRKKTSNNRNETHVQWWSRNKRPSNNNNNNNHLRRSNIYTAHPADSIRGLPQPTLSASSSLTAVSAMGAAAAAMQAPAAVPAHHQQEPQQQQLPQSQYYHQQQQQQHAQQQFQPHLALMVQQQQQQQHQKQQQQQHEYEYEHEYHQPQELQMRQRSSSVSSASATPSPSLKTTIATMMPLPVQLQRHHHHFHQQQQEQKREASSNIWQNGQSTLAVAS